MAIDEIARVAREARPNEMSSVGACFDANSTLGTHLVNELFGVDGLINDGSYTECVIPIEGKIKGDEGETQSHFFFQINSECLRDHTEPLIVDIAADQFTESNRNDENVPEVEVSLEGAKSKLSPVEIIKPGDPLFERYIGIRT